MFFDLQGKTILTRSGVLVWQQTGALTLLEQETHTRENTQQKGVWGMPKASDGDEGRGKRRNAEGTRWQGLILGYPNGATHYLEEIVPGDGGERGELKHLSSRRKRKQAVIPVVVASEAGRAQTD